MSASTTLLVCMSEQDMYDDIPLYRAILWAAQSSDLIWVRVNKSAEAFQAHRTVTSTRRLRTRSRRENSLIVQITGSESAVIEFANQYTDLLNTASGSAVLVRGCFL